MSNDLRKYLLEWVTVAAKGGFERERELRREIEVRVRDETEEGDPALVEELRDLAKGLFAKLREKEQEWGRPTANDAIDSAFAALNRAGIVALQNAGYTMSDGWEDCNEEASRRVEAGRPPRGAAFYHGQDLERGVAGKGLMLAFGAYATDKKAHDAASVAIGCEVVETLARFGVKTRWDETVRSRIAILPFGWQKRQFTKAPKIAPKAS
jgi:hypothetical protein